MLFNGVGGSMTEVQKLSDTAVEFVLLDDTALMIDTARDNRFTVKGSFVAAQIRKQITVMTGMATSSAKSMLINLHVLFHSDVFQSC